MNSQRHSMKFVFLIRLLILILNSIDLIRCDSIDLISNEFIQQQIVKLKPDSFNDDAVFLQDTNPSDRSTTYFYVDSKNALKIPVFVRNGTLDSGKSVVILHEHEDRLPTSPNKTTFVVLRQKEDQEKSYSAVIAYVTKSPHGLQIEWDIWDDRGLLSVVNKATLFGWTKCSYSSLVPCKSELQSVIPENAISPHAVDNTTQIFNPEDLGPDSFFDLRPKGENDGKFVGSTIDTMINSMVILAGVQIIYQNEDKLVSEVAKDIKSVVPSAQVQQTGRSFFGNSEKPEALDVASEIGAKRLVEKGREGIANAVLRFDSSVSNIGALAAGLSLATILSKSGDLVKDKDEDIGQISSLGRTLLRGLFEGASTEDKDEKFVNPNPKALLKTEVVEDLVSLRKISSERFLGRLFGFSFFGGGQEPPKEVGTPVNVKIGQEVLPVRAVDKGIIMNGRFIQGKIVPGDPPTPQQLKFVPEGQEDVSSSNIGSTTSTGSTGSTGVPVNVTIGNETVQVVAVTGGMVLNGKFFRGNIVTGKNPSEMKFVPEGASSSEFQPVTLPDGTKGYGYQTKMRINGTEVDVIQLNDGIIVNGKFVKGRIIKGAAGTDQQIIPGTGSYDSSPPSYPASDPTNPTSLSYPSGAQVPLQIPGSSTPGGLPQPGNDKPKSPMAYIFYIDNSTSHSTPLIAYVAPHGFLFYGLFFPGRVVDIYYIEISGQLFRADPVDRSKIRRGLMFPPMPSVYIVKVQGEDKISYFVGNGFLTETFFISGEEVEGGVKYNGFFYNATKLPSHSAPLMPAMAGAFKIQINSKTYIAYIVNQGVLIGGSFFPAKMLINGIEIMGVVYPGSYLNFFTLKAEPMYKILYYYDVVNSNMSNVLGQPVQGSIEFSKMYIKITALLKDGEVDTDVGTPLPQYNGVPGAVVPSPAGVGVMGAVSTGPAVGITAVTEPVVAVAHPVPPPGVPMVIHCPPGQRIMAPLGLNADVAQRIMQKDFLNEIIDWKPHMKTGEKTGSKALDNLGSIFSNSFNWNGEKSAGETFQENLVSGLWTPFGLADDIVDSIGHVTGAGKVSDDYGYIDDLFGVVLSGASSVGGVAGKIVDGVGWALNPVGLGGVWKTVAGITSGAIGIAGGAEATKVYGVYDLVKVSAKTVHLGWLLGLRGSESEKRKKELDSKVTQLQSIRAYLLAHPPQCMAIPVGGVVGAPPAEGVSTAAAAAAAHSLGFNGPGLADSYRVKRSPSLAGNVPVMITDVDLFSHVGWRTLSVKQEDLPNIKGIQEEPFVGIGACEHNKLTYEELAGTKSPKELMDFYMRSMRTQCLPSQRDALMDLIKFKHILATPEKTFVMNKDKELGNKKKLSLEDFEILSKGFEISAYSQTYFELLKSKSGSQSNISFLRKFIVNYINHVETVGAVHFNKLMRNLMKTLQTLYSKSLQDFYRFKYCPKCPEELIRNLMNDSLEILSLLGYVSNISNVGSTKAEMEKDLETWISSRQPEFLQKLQSYLV